ncbi:serine hydrolase domain-containing protein [Microbacter margulisiae]|uniref:CubicO group peptidase (Beta-lactamase class C family) n=1 Tax=Microbacter margulisiae TaxID=1350067 RepID=A0A7W5DTB6_9PORP|nr:serine hydrolase [Microbacter margulisiae]MBB3188199.1 CubicO group peptidase (beta-lactamase class C family) [Microbacter margulisiae]
MKNLSLLLLFLFANLLVVRAEQPTLNQLSFAEEHLTLLRNADNLIPLRTLDSARIVSISIGATAGNEFNGMMRRYMTFEKAAFDPESKDSVNHLLSNATLCVVSVFKSQLTPEETTWINSLSTDKYPVVLVSFVAPQQWMTKLPVTSWIEAYDGQVASQQMAAQLIFGGISAQGHLPFKLGKFHKGFGLTTPPAIRLKYTLPEEVGINGALLNHTIDSLVNDAIAQQAFPGCVILVARDGKVVFNKAYGFHTYFTSEVNHYPNDPLNRRENIYDLFDLASLTKIMAGAPAYLKLVDEGKINLNEKFSHYFPPFRGTNKENITVQELLCHVGGLQPYYPFYKLMVNPDGTLKPSFIRSDSSAAFPIRISPTLFIRKDIATWVYDSIAHSPLLKSNGKLHYVYSDWPFVVTPPVVEAIVHEPFEKYLQQTFYFPLGATEIMYNPWRRVPLSRVVPTEQDTFFRQTLLHGFVHDETSAILGGHSANAGLFANANDLAKLLQLYLQKGVYGGKRYFSEATFDLFNSTPYAAEGIYRGICFEKPDMKDGKVVGTSYLSTKVSPQSFGHTGYTGTMFWIDPKYNLVYIFLSNHVYPTRNNDKMFTTRIRAKVQTAIYDAINK